MLNARWIQKVCVEPIENIENYHKAMNDSLNYYSCHHRLEVRNIWGMIIHIGREELIGLGLYFHRPANELIFLTRSEHRTLHNSDPVFRKKISKMKKGCVSNRKGCHVTEEQKKRMSEGHIRNMNNKTREKLRVAYYKRQESMLAHLRKPIIQIDINTGKEVRRFDSIREANNFFGLPLKSSNIGSCCHEKRRTAYGYKWKFADK